MNELLFIVSIILNFVGIIVCYRIFGKVGLFGWIAFATVIANIEVVKCVTLFSFNVTLGNVIYCTTFLATDILSELYGDKISRKAVWLGFFTLTIFTILSQVNLLFVPNEQDFVDSALHTVFEFAPRICVASLIAYLLSNLIDTYLYAFIRKKLPNDKWLFVRNNGSTLISSLIDSIIFTMLAFFNVFEFNVVLELCFTTYFIKVIIALCDTPFLYLAKKINKKRNEKQLEQKELEEKSEQ